MERLWNVCSFTYANLLVMVQEGQVVCLKCGEFLESKEALERHTLNHKLKALFNCERCGEFFSRKQQYTKHLDTHDKYSCEHCGNAFSSRRRLTLHQAKELCRKPVPEPPPATDASQESAGLASAAMPEDGRAAEAKPYIKLKNRFRCRICVYEHAKASKVARHARCHSDTRIFVCEECGTAFKSMNTLRDHREYLHRYVRYFS